MPTYEFRCPNGHEFEQFYSRISLAPSVVECPTCGAVSEKLMSAGAGLVFKGSGFYITDYGKDGKKDQKDQKAAATGKSDGGASADASTSTSGDAKPVGDAKSPAESKSSADTTSSTDGASKAEVKPPKATDKAAPKSPPKSSGGDA